MSRRRSVELPYQKRLKEIEKVKGKTSMTQATRFIHGCADWLTDAHFTKLLKALGPYALILALFGLGWEIKMASEERKARSEARKVSAWQLLTVKAGGNSGKTEAMEYLHSIGKRLSGIDLSVEEGEGVSLSEAQLPGVMLRKSNLSEVDFVNANLTGADLSGANLTEAHLGIASLIGALLNETNLTGAYLNETNLTNAFLLEANLTNAFLWETNLTGADLTGADLTNAFFLEANLTNANLSGANLTGADLVCSQLTKAENWEMAFREENLRCGSTPIREIRLWRSLEERMSIP
ncbi:MAG: pentapeptide repeat-containing protein [Pseudomonadales bacterium]|nr:pentapeptide repeat-containing protein [Pseudomonadales bacterium]NRA15177.1 pentapeptide repeat-containing protein [Oceanospirillaceae bacterium]